MSEFKGPSLPAPNSTDLPSASIGKVLISLDGVQWTAELPLASGDGGWMTNDLGVLLVVGEKS